MKLTLKISGVLKPKERSFVPRAQSLLRSFRRLANTDVANVSDDTHGTFCLSIIFSVVRLFPVAPFSFRLPGSVYKYNVRFFSSFSLHKTNSS